MTPSPSMKPTMGRWLVFHHEPFTVATPSGENGKINIAESPALVQHVNPNGTVRLLVFGPFAAYGPTGINLVVEARESAGNAPPLAGTWSWPIMQPVPTRPAPPPQPST